MLNFNMHPDTESSLLELLKFCCDRATMDIGVHTRQRVGPLACRASVRLVHIHTLKLFLYANFKVGKLLFRFREYILEYARLATCSIRCVFQTENDGSLMAVPLMTLSQAALQSPLHPCPHSLSAFLSSSPSHPLQ